MAKLDIAALERLIATSFPQVESFAKIESLDADAIVLRVPVSESNLRPGGTVSGPTLMAAADLAVYLLLLSKIGEVTLAVTTQLHISFLRKPRAADVLAEARLLKLGRRLAVGEVRLHSDGDADLVGHATVTYAIPEGASGSEVDGGS